MELRIRPDRRKLVKRLGLALFHGVQGWINDRCSTMAASVAFYAAFSLAPTLVIVIAVAGFFYGADAVQGRLYGQLSSLLGHDGAVAVQAMVSSAWKADKGWITTAISLGAVAVGATATFAELNAALNTIWGIPPTKSKSGIMQLLRIRLISFGIVIGIGFLLVILLVLDAGLEFASHYLWSSAIFGAVLAQVAAGVTTLVLLAGAFVLLLKVLPDLHMRWSDVLIGGLAAALLFTGGKQLFGMYLARAGTVNAFGAAGSAAVILMWLYYSCAVFMLGAEIAVAWTRGGHRPAPADAPSSQHAALAPNTLPTVSPDTKPRKGD